MLTKDEIKYLAITLGISIITFALVCLALTTPLPTK